MAFTSANQPELIRSSQKDEQFQFSLRGQAHEACQAFAGAKKWLQWRKEIELLCDLTYYTLTTFSGYQTLGEEYVNIVQVDSSQRKVPSILQRSLLIGCHTLLPYFLDKELARLEQEIQIEIDGVRHSSLSSGSHHRSWMWKWMHRKIASLSEQQKKTLAKTVYVIRQSIAFLKRLHLATFYMKGTFYHIAKRITGISYLHVRGSLGDDRIVRQSYSLLGAISLVHLMLLLYIQLNHFQQKQEAQQKFKLHRRMSYQSSVVGNLRLCSLLSVSPLRSTIHRANEERAAKIAAEDIAARSRRAAEIFLHGREGRKVTEILESSRCGSFI